MVRVSSAACTLVIVVKCKFNKYDNLVILKIVAFIDKIVNKKFAKKGEEVDFKLWVE